MLWFVFVQLPKPSFCICLANLMPRRARSAYAVHSAAITEGQRRIFAERDEGELKNGVGLSTKSQRVVTLSKRCGGGRRLREDCV